MPAAHLGLILQVMSAMFMILIAKAAATLEVVSGGRATYWLHLLLGARPLLRVARTK